jgi:hypothetical protein
MKKYNNFNYLSTIDPNHPRLPPGQFSRRSMRRYLKNKSPVQVSKSIFEYSDGQKYMQLPNGQLVRVVEEQPPLETKHAT